MITHAIVTKVFGPTDKKKDGTPLVTKKGKPYKKIAIKTDKTGDVWYGYSDFFGDGKEINIKEGDEHLISFDDSGEFKNFSFPNKTDILGAKVDELEKRLKSLEHIINVQGAYTVKREPKEEPTIDTEDVPFP